MKTKLVYLGFFISIGGLKMDPKNIRAVVEWPIVVNVGEVRSFHKLTTSYRKFTRNFNNV